MISWKSEVRDLFPEENIGKCCWKRKKGCLREKMVGRDLEVGGIA